MVAGAVRVPAVRLAALAAVALVSGAACKGQTPGRAGDGGVISRDAATRDTRSDGPHDAASGDADSGDAGAAPFGAPAGLAAVPGDGVAYLTWLPVTADGYLVYRSDRSGEGYVAIASSPITEPAYRDATATNGAVWYYAVTAVRASEESARSLEVMVRPPDGSSSPPAAGDDERKLTDAVFRFELLVAAGEPEEAAATATGLSLTPERRLRLEVWSADADASALAAELSALGAENVRPAFDTVTAEVPPDRLDDVARLAGVSRISGLVLPLADSPDDGEVVSEGVMSTGAADLRAHGVAGTGVRVAVIDLGFRGIADVPGLSDAIALRWCPSGFGDGASGCRSAAGAPERYSASASEHGTGCAEIVHGMAPDAELYLYPVETLGELRGAIEDAVVTRAVDVISCSLSFLNLDDYDGSHPLARYVAGLAGTRVLFALAAGNQARTHVMATLDPVSGFHDFGASECIHRFGDGSTALVPCVPVTIWAGGSLGAFLEWNEWDRSPWGGGSGALSDLDLYLYHPSGGDVPAGPIAGSRNDQSTQRRPTEELRLMSPGGETTGYLSIHARTVLGTPRLQLFLQGAGRFGAPDGAGGYTSVIAPEQARTSLAFTVGAVDGVVTVGAVGWGVGSHEDYSARGPTVGGQEKPNIVGPAGVSSIAYGSASSPGTFSGTSAATPHVAGAAALWIEWQRRLGEGGGAFAIAESMVRRAWLPSDEAALLQSPAADCDDLAGAYGAGRVDVSPPVVFRGADGALYARAPIPIGTAGANPCDARVEADLRVRLAGEGSDSAVSPDGLWVAFSSSASGAPEIWKVRIDGAGLAQLTSAGVSYASYHPAWSPDGTRIAFTQRRRGINPLTGDLNLAYNVKVMQADGSSQEWITINDLTLNDQPWAIFPSWSLDGAWIAFTWVDPLPGTGGSRAGSYDIARISTAVRDYELRWADGSSLVERLTRTGVAARARYSPDGTWLLYQVITERPLPSSWPLQRTANGQIWVMNAVSGTTGQCSESGNDPAWSPSGEFVVFSRACAEPTPATAGLWKVRLVPTDMGPICDPWAQLTTNDCGGDPDRLPGW